MSAINIPRAPFPASIQAYQGMKRFKETAMHAKYAIERWIYLFVIQLWPQTYSLVNSVNTICILTDTQTTVKPTTKPTTTLLTTTPPAAKTTVDAQATTKPGATTGKISTHNYHVPLETCYIVMSIQFLLLHLHYTIH